MFFHHENLIKLEGMDFLIHINIAKFHCLIICCKQHLIIQWRFAQVKLLNLLKELTKDVLWLFNLLFIFCTLLFLISCLFHYTPVFYICVFPCVCCLMWRTPGCVCLLSLEQATLYETSHIIYLSGSMIQYCELFQQLFNRTIKTLSAKWILTLLFY